MAFWFMAFPGTSLCILFLVSIWHLLDLCLLEKEKFARVGRTESVLVQSRSLLGAQFVFLPFDRGRESNHTIGMNAEPKIIHEDKDFLVINKPSGMVVHGVRGKSSDELTLVDWLIARYPELKTVGDDPEERPGIVHRLDKDTSGIMIVPRNQASFEYFKSLFKERNIQKTYRAIVFGVPEKKEGTIDAPIGIQNGTTKRSVRSAKMAKPAVTEYVVVKTVRLSDGGGRENQFSLLSVHPKTGRTHQIRVHLASIGHPVVGDPMYGGKKRIQPVWATRLMLHAASIEFSFIIQCKSYTQFILPYPPQIPRYAIIFS